MPKDHVARARRAWPHLARRASSKGSPYTYGQLSKQINLHWRAAQWFLGVIQTYCRQHKLPPLQALAVNQKTRVPGKGYVGGPRSLAAHQKTLKRVYAHAWPISAPF
jgi:hypothetical protein